MTLFRSALDCCTQNYLKFYYYVRNCIFNKLPTWLTILNNRLFFYSTWLNTLSTFFVDYEETTGSKVCIVTAGVRQRQSETRLDLLKRNADIVKSIVVQLVKFSPDTVILMVTNPVDILTYIAWKVSGLPKERVIGSGTNLDTARFRCAISKKLGVGVSSCMGWIIGEHGDSSGTYILKFSDNKHFILYINNKKNHYI